MSQPRTRRALVTRALALLDAWSYREVEVPLLAPFDELRDAIGEQRSAQLFRFVDREGKLLVLRGDLTPVVARQFALRMRQESLPARLAYANRVARIERAFAGQQLESYELGMELVGSPGLAADLEVLTIAFDLLDALGVPDVELHLGDVRLLHGLVSHPAVPPDAAPALVRALRLRDAWEVRRIAAERSLPPAHTDALATLCATSATAQDLARLRASGVAEVAEAVDALGAHLEGLRELGLDGRVHIDLSARDERGYYTGMHLRIVSAGHGAELGRGGRYDRLYEHFGPGRPAVGFGLRVDRLVQLPGLEAPAPLAPDVVACRSARPAEALAEARRLRRAGERVRVDLDAPEGLSDAPEGA